MLPLLTKTALAGLAALLLMGASEASAPAPFPSDAPGWIEEAQGLIAASKPAAAVALCNVQGVTPSTKRPRARTTCAQAFLKLADRIYLIGLKGKARSYWLHASKLDLTLLDDSDFMVRLMPEPATPPKPATPPPAPPVVLQPMPAASSVTGTPTLAEKAAPSVVTAAPSPPGPRADTDFYFGLGGGFDGLASLHVGWCHEERVLIETSVGWIFPVIDTRVRVLGWRGELTPYIGAGMTTPLTRQDTLGMDLPGYESLYALGQTVHVDLGLAWAFHSSWEAFGGAAFVTSLDGNDPNQIVFFPQLAFQISYHL